MMNCGALQSESEAVALYLLWFMWIRPGSNTTYCLRLIEQNANATDPLLTRLLLA